MVNEDEREHIKISTIHTGLAKNKNLFFRKGLYKIMKEDPSLNQKYKGQAVVSWTGGKDSCLACYEAISEGFKVSHLLNFRERNRCGAHEINPKLLAAQAEAVGVPLIRQDFNSYEQEFKKVVRELKENGVEIDAAVFGHIETHEKLVERICEELGLQKIMPLWKRNSTQLIRDLIEAGFEAVLVSVKADLFGKAWLGRKIDEKFLNDLASLDSTIDTCGENGEFHTFVTDGPIFKKKLRITEGEKYRRGNSWFLDITGYATEKK